MQISIELFILIASILLFFSILVGKTGCRFGVPTLLLFLLIAIRTRYCGQYQILIAIVFIRGFYLLRFLVPVRYFTIYLSCKMYFFSIDVKHYMNNGLIIHFRTAGIEFYVYHVYKWDIWDTKSHESSKVQPIWKSS